MSTNKSNAESICFKNCSISNIPNADAILCENGTIKRVGWEREMPESKTVDLQGGVVYPGFSDSHLHLLGLGKSLRFLNLKNMSSLSLVLDLVHKKIKTCKKNDWVQGWGWDQNTWSNKNYPDKSALDALSPDIPIYLKRIDGHAAWANSRALRVAGIDGKCSNPPGGKILRNELGQPTGILIDNAMNLIDRVLPKHSKSENKMMILEATSLLNSLGLTSVHDAGTNIETFKILKELIDENILNISVYAMLENDPATYERFLLSGPLCDVNSFLHVKSLKLFLDGALGSRGAALLEPYNDDSKTLGLLLLNQDEALEKISEFNSAGFQVCLHCIGDRANRIGLNILERGGKKEMRNRIEHAQIIHPEDLNRFSSLGVIPSMQSVHCTSDMPWIEQRIGERASNAYLWNSLVRSGSIIPGGSDAPIESPNPIAGIYASVTRKNSLGQPKNGWHANQCLDIDQAIQMYTEWPAYASFQEKTRGKICPGYFADFSVLSKNLRFTPSEEMLDTKILFTIVKGKTVYSQ